MKHLISVIIFAVFSNLLWAGQMKLLAPQNSYPTDTRSDSIDIINTSKAKFKKAYLNSNVNSPCDSHQTTVLNTHTSTTTNTKTSTTSTTANSSSTKTLKNQSRQRK